MRFRPVSTICVLLALAAFGYSGFAGQGTPSQFAAPKSPPVQSLSKSAKLARAQGLLHYTPKGILDTLTLTVNQPAVKDKGCIGFDGFTVRPDYLAHGDAVASNESLMYIDFLVARPNKRHLLTFYVYSPQSQSLSFLGSVGQTVAVHGSAEAMVGFTPTKRGRQVIYMLAKKPVSFYSVDVDVLD